MTETNPAHKFGIIAVEKGFADKSQVTRALAEQNRLADKGETVRIGDILIESEVITEEQRDEIIKEQENLIRRLAEKGKRPQNDSGFELTVSTDKLDAFICPMKKNLPEVGLDAIKLLLEKEGIKSGIVDDARITEYIASKPSTYKHWKIAEGKAPDPGKPPEIKYYFDTDPLEFASIHENGKNDPETKVEIPQVVAGDLLAKMIPGEEGTPGEDVFGEIIPPQEYPAVKILCGKGARKIENDAKAVAEISGRPLLENDGMICVSDTLSISGDLGVGTGNIAFDGHIEVRGTVKEGYQIKGKTLKAKSIHNAEIEIEGDIVVSLGIMGSKILTDGSVKARHIRNTTIDALGDVIVEREALNSQIETNGIFNIERGKLLGSMISAMKGIDAAEIGSLVGIPSQLTVGVDNRLERTIANKRIQIEDKEKEKNKLENLLEETKESSENLQDEIVVAAQEQDVAVAKGKTLKQTFDSLKRLDNRINIVKIVRIINAMNLRLERIEKDLNILIEKQKQAEEDIESHKIEIIKLGIEIQGLEDDIKSFVELANIKKNIATIKSSGTIYDRTFIKGQYASLTLRKDTKHVLIQEVKHPSRPAEEAWGMDISPL